jgi:hypothetical protein
MKRAQLDVLHGVLRDFRLELGETVDGFEHRGSDFKLPVPEASLAFVKKVRHHPVSEYLLKRHGVAQRFQIAIYPVDAVFLLAEQWPEVVGATIMLHQVVHEQRRGPVVGAGVKGVEGPVHQ